MRLAVDKEHLQVVQLLLQAGAVAKGIDWWVARSPMHMYACVCSALVLARTESSTQVAYAGGQ